MNAKKFGLVMAFLLSVQTCVPMYARRSAPLCKQLWNATLKLTLCWKPRFVYNAHYTHDCFINFTVRIRVLTLKTTYKWSNDNILKLILANMASFDSSNLHTIDLSSFYTRLLGLSFLNVWFFSDLFQIQFSICFCSL